MYVSLHLEKVQLCMAAEFAIRFVYKLLCKRNYNLFLFVFVLSQVKTLAWQQNSYGTRYSMRVVLHNAINRFLRLVTNCKPKPIKTNVF